MITEYEEGPPTFSDLHGLADSCDIKSLQRLNHHLLDAIEELQQQHIHLRNEFARLYATSVPMVTDAMRRAGRFLRKGKHENKPHEWVVVNDPQYVVYCDDKSAALALGFTDEEIKVARRALTDNPSLRDRMYSSRRAAAIAKAT